MNGTKIKIETDELGKFHVVIGNTKSDDSNFFSQLTKVGPFNEKPEAVEQAQKIKESFDSVRIEPVVLEV